MDGSINKIPTRSWLLKRNYWDGIIRDVALTMKDWTHVINKSSSLLFKGAYRDRDYSLLTLIKTK